jgi:hypothetical protein
MRSSTMPGTGPARVPHGRVFGVLVMVIAIVFGIFVAAGLSSEFAAASAAGTTPTVTIGGRSHLLNGVNVERQPQYLVAYTRTETQTVTPTNTWGAEVTVIGGKVSAINDRWFSKTGPTTIPSGAIVLSGHDAARDWILANVKVGATVLISGARLPSTVTTAGTSSATAAASTSSASPTATTPTGSAAPSSSTSVPVTLSRSWLSGASGEGVADGTFAIWRGTPVDVVGTWSDTTATDQTQLWGIQPGLEYGNWTGSADIAIGAIFAGETWAAAAQGAYDARWTRSLALAKKLWNAKQRGTLYIRFAHEWNGNWTPWSVSAADLANFKTAWQRFYNLKQTVFPTAKLVFCTNGDTVGQNYDWRIGWPGNAYVDVYATDWYSMHWNTWGADGADRFGGPTGLEAHRQFALAHGKPFAVPEWGNNIDVGDQPNYIQYMRDFFTAGGGTGAGKVTYEIYFNVIWSPNKFGLFPQRSTLAPNAAARYKDTF